MYKRMFLRQVYYFHYRLQILINSIIFLRCETLNYKNIIRYNSDILFFSACY